MGGGLTSFARAFSCWKMRLKNGSPIHKASKHFLCHNINCPLAESSVRCTLESLTTQHHVNVSPTVRCTLQDDIGRKLFCTSCCTNLRVWIVCSQLWLRAFRGVALDLLEMRQCSRNKQSVWYLQLITYFCFMRMGGGKGAEIGEELWNTSTKEKFFHCLESAPSGWASDSWVELQFGSQFWCHPKDLPVGCGKEDSSQSPVLLWGPSVWI